MNSRSRSGKRIGKSGARVESCEKVRTRLLANPEVRFHYDALKIREEIGEAVAEARKAAGLTQAQVAVRAGTTQPVIARMESGRGGVPSLDLLNRVARAMGFRVAVGLVAGRAA